MNVEIFSKDMFEFGEVMVIRELGLGLWVSWEDLLA
jgi:hypothetical protein